MNSGSKVTFNFCTGVLLALVHGEHKCRSPSLFSPLSSLMPVIPRYGMLIVCLHLGKLVQAINRVSNLVALTLMLPLLQAGHLMNSVLSETCLRSSYTRNSGAPRFPSLEGFSGSKVSLPIRTANDFCNSFIYELTCLKMSCIFPRQSESTLSLSRVPSAIPCKSLSILALRYGLWRSRPTCWYIWTSASPSLVA